MSEKSPQSDQADPVSDDKSVKESTQSVVEQKKAEEAPTRVEDVSAESPQPQKKAVKKSAKKAAKKSSPSAPKGDADTAKDDQVSEDTQSARKQPRRGRVRGKGRQLQEQPKEPKPKLDQQKIAKRAWKIFLGEVNEEGLVLIADKDARELARRSLRVAEIYSHEEALALKKDVKDKAPEKSVPEQKTKPPKKKTGSQVEPKVKKQQKQQDAPKKEADEKSPAPDAKQDE